MNRVSVVTMLAAVASVSLLPAFAIPSAPEAVPSASTPTMADAEGISNRLLGPSIADFCVDCEPCDPWPAHEAPADPDGGWPAGHGAHSFCWTEFTCEDRHGGHTCAPLPLPEILEGARLAAISATPEEFLRLSDSLSAYVAFNEKRGSIQVKACDGRIVANLPVQWADQWSAPAQ